MQHFSNTNFNIKELLYKSWYRGCKETDILIGNFVREYHESFTNSDLALLKELMEESDHDMYNWIVGISKSPAKYAELISRITEFNISNARKKTQS